MKESGEIERYKWTSKGATSHPAEWTERMCMYFSDGCWSYTQHENDIISKCCARTRTTDKKFRFAWSTIYSIPVHKQHIDSTTQQKRSKHRSVRCRKRTDFRSLWCCCCFPRDWTAKIGGGWKSVIIGSVRVSFQTKKTDFLFSRN